MRSCKVRMSQLAIILIASWLAGATAFVGGVIAVIEGRPETATKREFIHGVIAFGGGILVAAVAFALVPEVRVRGSNLLLALA